MPGTGTRLRVSWVAGTIAQAAVRRPSRLARHGILRRDDMAAYVKIGAPLFRRHRWALRTPWLRIFALTGSAAGSVVYQTLNDDP
jgi:hypothetical protein